MSGRRYPDLAGLRELAERASGASWQSAVSIEFRMAFDPATALALLDRIEGTPADRVPVPDEVKHG